MNKSVCDSDWAIVIATTVITFFLLWLGMSMAHYPLGQ